MRTPTVIGATLLLVAGLAAGPAAALPATSPGHDGDSRHSDGRHSDGRGGRDGHWGGKDWDDSNVGGHWDGGSGYYDGDEYGWPEDTYSYDGNVCPDMDVAKTDVSGDHKTITLTAPEGKLISAYCVKAGSAKQGEGPKVVAVDPPAKQVTIAYPVGGKCRDISHYSVAYVDATTPSPSPTTPAPEQSSPPATQPPTTDEPAPPAEPTEPGDTSATPAPSDDAGTPAAGAGGSDDQATGDQPGDDTDTPSSAPEGNDDRAGDDADAETVANDVDTEGDDDASAAPVTTAARSELAFTGAQVAALVLAALALVGVGAGALIVTRRRRTADGEA